MTPGRLIRLSALRTDVRDRLDRRRALQLGGLAALSAVAGCIGDDDPDSNDDTGSNTTDAGGNDTDESETDDAKPSAGAVPEYAEYLTLSENNQIFVTYADMAALRAAESLAPGDNTSDTGSQGSLENLDDALLSVPVQGVFFLFFGGTFTLGTAGLSPLVNSMQSAGFESEVDEYFTASGTTVLVGDIETDEIAETLTTLPAERQNFFRVEYEQTGGYAGHTLYQTKSSDSTTDTQTGETSAQTVAVSEESIILAGTQSAVERVIDAATGDSASMADEYDEFAWLLSTASGDISLGVYGPDGYENTENGSETTPGGSAGAGNTTGTEEPTERFEELQQAKGFVGSLTYTADGASATTAMVFEDSIGEDLQSATRDAFGSMAAESSFTFEEKRLTVTGSYTPETLQNLGENTDNESGDGS
jgi:hypothetical protein